MKDSDPTLLDRPRSQKNTPTTILALPSTRANTPTLEKRMTLPARSASGTDTDPDIEGGRYEIIEKIGQGAMAEIYLARDTYISSPSHQELVALKIFSRDNPWGEQIEERIRIEVRASRGVVNPHVVRVYGLTRTRDKRWAIPMEHVKGRSLASILRDPLEIDYLRFARWGAEIARGLHAAHQVDVVHRDLKPENIIIREDDTAAILDFGIAKFFGQNVTLTAEGSVVGTLLYMAPEQFHSIVDPRSDLYALGLILARLPSGAVPRAADLSAEGIYVERVDQPVPYRLLDHAPDAPRDYARIIDRLLEAAPSARFQTGADVAEALEAMIRDAEADTRLTDLTSMDDGERLEDTRRLPERRPAPRPTPRPRWLLAATIVGLVLLSAAAVLASFVGGTVVARSTTETHSSSTNPPSSKDVRPERAQSERK